jgi:predicted phosphodiesterase
LKLAVLADVHANLIALQAIIEDVQTWNPDHVIVAGDILNRGPRPLECLQLIGTHVESEGWSLLLGNHEEYVLKQGKPDIPKSGPAFDVHLASYWTYNKIAANVSLLHSLPIAISLVDPIGEEVRVTHASMMGIRDGIYPGMSDEVIRKRIGVPPRLFCIGHTHIPLVRHVDSTLVVNVGSAGLPFDGDLRPSYARMTWHKSVWEADIVRLSYDIERAELDFYETGYISQAGPLTRLVLLELHQARSHLYQWAAGYQDLVLGGEFTMEQSVDEYIRTNT